MSHTEQMRDALTVSLFTEQKPDGTWCAHMLVSGLPSESMADAAIAHMQNLFCGQETPQAD